MSFDPEIIYNNIKKYMPDFHMEYKVDPLRQAIAESWPNSLDDTCAREERLPESGYAFVWLSPACQQPARQKSHFVAAFS